MRHPSRGSVFAFLALAIVAFGVTNVRAICGVPGIVTSSAFGGGTGTVILYNPVAPFNFTGMATVTFGPAAANKQ